MRWNKTTASYGCFHIDREHSRTENANVFFSSSPTIDCKKNGRSVRDVTRRFLKSIFEA